MSKEAQIETIRGFIRAGKQTLESMRSRAELLNRAIPALEQTIKEEEARLKKLEAK